MNQPQHNLMPIDEFPGLYVDAILTDSSYLKFLSIWGRDTEMQEFLARLTLTTSEAGLTGFRVNAAKSQYVQVGSISNLEKLSGRMKNNILGEVTHLWLFDKVALQPDYSGRRALFIYQASEDTVENRESLNGRLWGMVCEVCHLPLLPQWRDQVLSGFTALGFLTRLPGIGVSAIAVTLPDQEVEDAITGWIKIGRLTLDEPHVNVNKLLDNACVISYSRAEAIADEVLIDVTTTAKEAGFNCPVAITQGVYAECVAWSDEDSLKQAYQDEPGRLWDVLWMAKYAASQVPDDTGQERLYELYCVPRDGKSSTPLLINLRMHAGPGDNGELVITIMLPTES